MHLFIYLSFYLIFFFHYVTYLYIFPSPYLSSIHLIYLSIYHLDQDVEYPPPPPNLAWHSLETLGLFHPVLTFCLTACKMVTEDLTHLWGVGNLPASEG